MPHINNIGVINTLQTYMSLTLASKMFKKSSNPCSLTQEMQAHVRPNNSPLPACFSCDAPFCNVACPTCLYKSALLNNNIQSFGSKASSFDSWSNSLVSDEEACELFIGVSEVVLDIPSSFRCCRKKSISEVLSCDPLVLPPGD